MAIFWILFFLAFLITNMRRQFRREQCQKVENFKFLVCVAIKADKGKLHMCWLKTLIEDDSMKRLLERHL